MTDVELFQCDFTQSGGDAIFPVNESVVGLNQRFTRGFINQMRDDRRVRCNSARSGVENQIHCSV